MNPFNLYEIARVFDEMRENCYKHETIGVLDKKNGRCLYIGHVDDLPKLIDEQIDLQHALFIPENGYAQTGRLWTPEYVSRGEAETVVREYIPELLPLFQSLEYPFSKKDQKDFDKALFDLDDALDGILPFGSGFFAFVDVHVWCMERQIPLMHPRIAYDEFIERRRKERDEERKKRDAIIPFRCQTTDDEVLLVDKETGELLRKVPFKYKPQNKDEAGTKENESANEF